MANRPRTSAVVHSKVTTFSIIHAGIICLLLSSCAAVPQTVSVPVAVEGLPLDTPVPPATSTNEQLALMSDYELVLRIVAERLDLISYAQQAEVVIQGCR